MRSLINLVTGIFVSVILSCSPKTNNTNKQKEALDSQITALSKIKISATNTDSVRAALYLLYNNPVVIKDTILATASNYSLARFYAMQHNDSAEQFIEKAIELIEPTKDNWGDKALIYNGMGNVWNSKSKEHQANFYYNKGATIVLADTGVDLSASVKTNILLAAAQSNKILYQNELALQMNKVALALAPQLPKEHTNAQRSLTQIIQLLGNQKASSDSIQIYLKKLETLHEKYPDNYDISYLYECKSVYFERKEQQDSLLYYQTLKSERDLEKYNKNPKEQANINNLLTTYSNIAGINVNLKAPATAAIYLDKAAKILADHQELVSIEGQAFYKTNLAALYELQGKYAQAVPLLFDAYEMQKKNYQTQNTQAVAEMNTLYQLQAKDRSIHTLNENIKINRLQLEQNKLWLVIAFLMVVLLGIVLSFFYYHYRQRKMNQSKEKLLLQQQLLRTQMEPHFIFNTLSAVQSFVRFDQKDTAIKYLNRFSRLLRSSLELSRESLVPLDEEIEALDNYLSLQQMRFENSFSYHIQKPAEADFGSIMLPPMLIQPYVENAIIHGIDLTSNNAAIDIGFNIIDKDLIEITITDTGNSNPIIAANPGHRSLSGNISQERIALLGKKANVTITPGTRGHGTVVTLNIPLAS